MNNKAKVERIKDNSEKDLFELNPRLKKKYFRLRAELKKDGLLGNLKFQI